MIKLSNVGKVYATRRRRNIYGLKDVNLSFPDKGLCLILGQSGSGKTTLLNILGGLDVKFEGEYEFLDKKLTQKDFPELRQNHIGFVFQDFNLIDDMNVYDNVALGAQLSQGPTSDVSEALDKVGLSGYEKRYPDELSGGQQQRVAIARALLKQSSVLLADEPTGNLDKDNSVDVYGLLKEISREKLVIIVSHDEELGLKYADYVVRLRKGKVTESSLPEVSNERQYTSSKSRIISDKQAFKMGAREITRNKVKSAFTIAIMAICFCVLSFTILVVPLFKMSDVHYSLIRDKDYEQFCLTNVDYDEYRALERRGVEMAVSLGNYVTMSPEQMAEHGIELYDGALPLDYNSYYVSDYALTQLATPDMVGKLRNEAIINGEETRFTVGTILNLVGQRIKAYGYDKICAGIFKSELKILDDEFTIYSHIIDTAIITPCVEVGANNGSAKIYAKYDGKTVDVNGVFDFSLAGTSKYLLTTDGVVHYENDELESSLKGNEVVVGVETFNRIFQREYTAENLLTTDGQTVTALRIPSELGASVSLVASDGKTVDVVVKGIAFADQYGYFYNDGNEIIFSNDNLESRNQMVMATRMFNVWIATDSVKDVRGLLATHNSYAGSCDIYTPVSKYEFSISQILQTVQLALLIVSLVLLIVTILMTNLLISGQIVGQKRKIGIYKALGATNGDIIKIYLYEMLLIVLPIIILAIASTAAVTAILNNRYVEEINKNVVGANIDITVIYYQWVNIPITIAVVFAVVFVGIIAPLRKIVKLNVIEAIKGTVNK